MFIRTLAIEGDLFQALIKAGFVREENAASPERIRIGRSSRTDKGVHSLKVS